MKKNLQFIFILCGLILHSDLHAQQIVPIHLKNVSFTPPAKEVYKYETSSTESEIVTIQLKDRTQLNNLMSRSLCSIKILDQFSTETYTISITHECLETLIEDENVITIFDFPSPYKISNELTEQGYQSKIKAKVCVYGIYDEMKLNTIFPDHNISEVVSFGQNTYFIIESDLWNLEKIAKNPILATIEKKPLNYTFLNFYKRSIEAVQAANVSEAMGGLGLTGTGITIGHGDAGAFDHVDLNDRVIEFSPKGQAIHASHTAGTLIGAGNLQEKHKGIAYGAKIVNADGYDIVTYLSQFRKNFDIHVTNNSYAAITKDIDCTTMGEYTIFSKESDESTVRYPDVLHVWASGNSGALICGNSPLAYNSVLSGPQCSKNGITVGSIWRREGTPVAEFSCQGPTDDGRIKPEIVAQGTNTTSAGAENNYYTTNGTSMSAPSITSTAAFMQENYKKKHNDNYPSSALLKAILVNTADDLFNEGPEFSNGYGKVNTAKAARMAGNDDHVISLISEEEVQDFLFTIPTQQAKAVITLCWVDPAGNPLTTRQLINDLDLEVSGPGGLILPWVLDPSPAGSLLPAARGRDTLNNLEQISFLNPEPGTYTIKVKGKKVNGAQEFALCYRTEDIHVTMCGPFGGEKYLPGEFQYFQWECPLSNGNNFDIELSLDDGLNWQIIGTKSDSFRTLNYAMPMIRTDLGRIRVTHPDFGSTTSGRFTISPLPPNFKANATCESYADLTWSPIAEAVKYKIFRKEGFYMSEVAETVDTSYQMTGLDPASRELLSVAAVYPNGGVGRRALGQFVTATGAQCPWSKDLTISRLVSPNIGRKNTMTELSSTEQISVLIKNLGTSPTSGFKVYYDPGNGKITEDFNGIIAGGAEQIFNFTIPVNFSDPGHYPILIGIEPGFDEPYIGNNELADTVIQLENEALILTDDLNTTFKIDFESALPATYTNGNPGLAGIDMFDFFSTSPGGRARTFVLNDIARSGNRALTLDSKLEGTLVTSDAIATLNLSNYSVSDNVRFDFSYLNHNNDDTTAQGSKVWVRGNESEDWLEIYDLEANQAKAGNYKDVHGINIAKFLKINGQDFSSSTQIKFSAIVNGPVIRNDAASGYTIDDIYLHLVNNDLAILKISDIAQNECGLTSSESITIEIENSDINVADNVQAWYRINNGIINGPFDVGNINGEAIIQFNFPNVDFSQPGAYAIDAWISSDADTYRSNDTLETFNFFNNRFLSTFPYLESFENDNGDWFPQGSSSSWQWGIPNKQIINRAANGSKAWTTDLNRGYNAFERSYLVSPCFDLSGFTSDPMISFSMIYDIEVKYDKIRLEISDNGKDWSILGKPGDGINWYNNEKNYWEGTDDQWHVAGISIPLENIINKGTVQFRFVVESDESLSPEGIGIDDIHIYDGQSIYTGENILVSKQTTTDWTDYISAGKIIASIKPNTGQDLGITEVGVYFNPDATQRNDGNQYYLDRNFTIKPTNEPLAGTVSLRLYFTDEEVLKSRNATDTFDKPTTAYELGVSQILSGENDGQFGNETDATASYINYINSELIPYQNGYYIEFTVDHFSEFYINPGGPENKLPLGVKFISKTNDYNKKSHFQAALYPNPSGSNFNLEMSGLTPGKEVNVRIFDLFGKEVYRDKFISQSTTGIKNYDLSLNSGLYFILISNNGYQNTVKLSRL